MLYFKDTQNEVLDKEAKSYKEKETLQHRHQTPIYNKQNHRPNPVINHFPENNNFFANKEQYQEMVIMVTQSETARKRS